MEDLVSVFGLSCQSTREWIELINQIIKTKGQSSRCTVQELSHTNGLHLVFLYKFINKISLYFIYMGVLPVYMYAHHHMHTWCPQKAEAGVGSPGTEVQLIMSCHVSGAN